MVTLDYFKSLGKPFESSDTHASSSSAPAGPDHGSTNVVQAPGPNPASSTANSGLSTEPQLPGGHDEWHNVPLDSQTSSMHGPLPKLPNPNPRPSTDSGIDSNSRTNLKDTAPLRPATLNPKPATDNFDWNYWTNLKDSPPASPKPSNSKSGFKWFNKLRLLDPLPRPGSSKPSNPKPSTKSGSSWLDKLSKLDPLPRPGLSKPYNSMPNPKPSTKSRLDWLDKWASWVDPLPRPARPAAASSKSLKSYPSDPGPSTSGSFDSMASPRPLEALRIKPLKPGSANQNEAVDKEVVHRPPPTPEPTGLEYHSDHSSLSTDSQPLDLQAIVYAAKGKAKQARSISGAARNFGNASEGVAAC